MIDAHRLLKNTIARDTYVLMTNDYLRSADKTTRSETGWYDIEHCNWYDLGHLCYHHFYHADQRSPGLEMATGHYLN